MLAPERLFHWLSTPVSKTGHILASDQAGGEGAIPLLTHSIKVTLQVRCFYSLITQTRTLRCGDVFPCHGPRDTSDLEEVKVLVATSTVKGEAHRKGMPADFQKPIVESHTCQVHCARKSNSDNSGH